MDMMHIKMHSSSTSTIKIMQPKETVLLSTLLRLLSASLQYNQYFSEIDTAVSH